MQGLWGHKNVDWLNVNPDVNVLVGINGSGKTTLMNIMYAYYTNDTKELRKYKYQEIQGVPLRKSINARTEYFHQAGDVLHLEQLSSGEKQLLLILLKVFLLDKKPAIIFMDELEISLHIRWQREIIDRMRQINPFCQIIIATHSPSMFGTGWGDKVVYMEDIIK